MSIDHADSSVYNAYLSRHYDVFTRPTGRQIGKAWNDLAGELGVSMKDIPAVQRLKRAVLEFFVADRPGGCIFPDLDKVVEFDRSPLASVKVLLQVWYNHSLTDRSLRDALAPEVRDAYENRAFSESVGREGSPEVSLPKVAHVSMAEPEEKDVPWTDDIDAELDRIAREFSAQQAQPPQHQGALVPNSARTVELASATVVKNHLRKELQSRLRRNFDDLPEDTRLVIPDSVLLVAERWPEVDPVRLLDALVKRFHSGIKSTKKKIRLFFRSCTQPARRAFPRSSPWCWTRRRRAPTLPCAVRSTECSASLNGSVYSP
eukprot:PhM_4_TR424/c0_g1_i4/m.71453